MSDYGDAPPRWSLILAAVFIYAMIAILLVCAGLFVYRRYIM